MFIKITILSDKYEFVMTFALLDLIAKFPYFF